MSISAREKRTLKLGGVAAAAILVYSYLLNPILQQSAAVLERLVGKEAQVTMLRDSVDGPNSVLNRREVMARRLGTLLGEDVKIAEEPSQEKEGAQPPEGDAGEVKEGAESPEGEADEVKEGAEPPDGGPSEVREGPKPPKGGAGEDNDVASYLSKAAATSGAKIKRISPKRTSARRGGNAYFMPTSLTVTLESKSYNFMQFLYELEHGKRFMRVDRISYRLDAAKDTVSVDLDVVAYQSTGG